MNPETRKVTVFIAIGSLFAVLMGIAVWRLSAPNTTPPDLTADTATETTTTLNSTATSRHLPLSPSALPNSAEPTLPGHPVITPADDPYLPPHAVVAEQPADPTPTKIYRPTNVTPTRLFPDPQAPQPRPARKEPTWPPTSSTTTKPIPPTQPAEVSVPSTPAHPTDIPTHVSEPRDFSAATALNPQVLSQTETPSMTAVTETDTEPTEVSTSSALSTAASASSAAKPEPKTLRLPRKTLEVAH